MQRRTLPKKSRKKKTERRSERQDALSINPLLRLPFCLEPQVDWSQRMEATLKAAYTPVMQTPESLEHKKKSGK